MIYGIIIVADGFPLATGWASNPTHQKGVPPLPSKRATHATAEDLSWMDDAGPLSVWPYHWAVIKARPGKFKHAGSICRC